MPKKNKNLHKKAEKPDFRENDKLKPKMKKRKSTNYLKSWKISGSLEEVSKPWSPR